MTTSTNYSPNAVLIAPDGCTKYLASAVERDLSYMRSGDVLEVRCQSPLDRLDLADWCLNAGKRVLNPFDDWRVETLVIENTPGIDQLTA